MKTVSIELSTSGIQKLQKILGIYEKILKKKRKKFVEECAKKGVQIAKVEFAKAEYTGYNDHDYTYQLTDDNSAIVRVSSHTVLFIEFGTGINYPDIHPEAHENGMLRGKFEYGMGRFPKWRYKGEPAGTLGEVIPEGEPHAGEIISRGNPANMSLYHTREQLAAVCVDIAKEVFK